jgi:hypothetical protein
MDKRKVLEALVEARGRLAPPGAWTKGEFARDADGHAVDSLDPAAVCFCAAGAIDATTAGDFNLYSAARDALMEDMDSRGLAHFNDTQNSVEPVLAQFDKTIARLESEVSS